MTETTRKVYKVAIDKNACIGAATCVVIAPKAFVLDKDGVVEALSTVLDHTDEELIQAAKSCPTQAIKLLDENGNEIAL
ncbi:ferredoxin [candidate division WWE3 bacterium]|nr:ferredoxin [candidate division WWE3 bacterium]